jgi:DNA-binding transcriptional LysR family regulator
VARANSFRTAATRLNMTGHGVANRIAQLERVLNVLLFTRHRDGVRLTPDGQSLLSYAEQMEEASLGFVRGRGKSTQPYHGEVRVAVTEGLGTFWLTPRLMEFARTHPQILIDLHCSMQRPDELIVRAQADVAIQIEQPGPRDLMVRRIGRMHILPCASQSYIDTFGKPASKDELIQRHRIVVQFADQGRAAQFYSELFPDRPQTGFVGMRTDVSTAMYAAVVNSIAVGWLPTYYFAIGAKVVPIDIGCIYSLDIWLSYHPDLGKLPRVRRMIDWAIEAFDPKGNPWFRDEFVHPSDFEKHLQDGAAVLSDSAFGRPKRIR